MVQILSVDGSTSADIIDQEAVFMRYLESNPPGLDQVKISTDFVSTEDVSAKRSFQLLNSLTLLVRISMRIDKATRKRCVEKFTHILRNHREGLVLWVM